jgi:cytochrome P450
VSDSPTAPLYPPTVTPPSGDAPFLAYIPRLIANPLRVVPQSVYEDPIVPYRFLRTKLVWVASPDLIEQVLLHQADRFVKSPLEQRTLGPTLGDGMLTAQGASWRWQRKVAAPLFRHADVLAYVTAMALAAETQLATWLETAGPARSPFTADVELAMKVTTFDIIVSTILSGCDAREADIIQRADTDYMSPITWEMAAAVLGLPTWAWHPAKRQMRNAARDLRAAVLAIVQRRRASEATTAAAGGDILARLLAARNPDTGEPMSDERMVDNLATFLEAGHQTTAQALSWTLYLLARAPDWQDRVRREILDVCGAASISGAHIDQLPMTTRVLKEAMRLYPPVPTMIRIANADTTLGSELIRQGTLVIIPIFALQRHKALWHDPGRFDPDRFLPGAERALQRAQYMPFGFGARTCIGMPFALVEGVAILAALLRGVRFAWDGHHLPEPISQITLHPKGGMPLVIEPV